MLISSDKLTFFLLQWTYEIVTPYAAASDYDGRGTRQR